MELPLDPDLALTGLPFGVPRAVVRDFFGVEPQQFRRNQASREDDNWAELGAFASYDEAENLEALELSSSANPSLLGDILTLVPLQRAKQLLRQADPDLEVEDSAATSKALGIAIWAGAGDHGMVQAVLRFARGYYD